MQRGMEKLRSAVARRFHNRDEDDPRILNELKGAAALAAHKAKSNRNLLRSRSEVERK